MFTIKVDEHIIKHCKNQVDQHNFGKRYTGNGNKEQQLTGIIGQSVMMSLFNQGLVDGESGFDNGIDITYDNKKIDVKTMGRTTNVRNNFTNNFLKLQDYLETEIYIFCSYHTQKKELTVCGVIDKNTFIKKRNYFPKGSVRTRDNKTSFETFEDLYEIDNTDLFNVDNIDHLKKTIEQIKINKQITMEQKNNTGAIFKNDYKKTEQHPDYKGKAMIDGKAKDVAVWLNESQNGKKYFSIKFSEPYKEAEASKQDMPQYLPNKLDDLPF